MLNSAIKKNSRRSTAEMDGGSSATGSMGKDLILKIAVGTVIHNITNGTDMEVKKVGGMRAPCGRRHRRARLISISVPLRNTTPMQFQGGRPGEAFTFRLELEAHRGQCRFCWPSERRQIQYAEHAHQSACQSGELSLHHAGRRCQNSLTHVAKEDDVLIADKIFKIVQN